MLVVRGLSKTYPGQVALKNVDIRLAAGEVHALLGGNGSGKSTLIKILAGYHTPDPGYLAWLDGRPIALGSPSLARDGGLRFIHQDLALVPELSIIDNMALGSGYQGRLWLKSATEAAAVAEILEQFELHVDPRMELGRLSAAQRTVVAVARALRGGFTNTRILVLDEPSANLPTHEVDLLFSAIRTARSRGVAILYVTHRLQELYEIADTVTVLRDGCRVANCAVSTLTSDELVTHVAGRPLDLLYPTLPDPCGEAVLKVRNLHNEFLRDVSLDLRRGEIVGVAGITGSGRDVVNRAIFGSIPASGEVYLDERRVDPVEPGNAISSGIAYLPPDRKTLSTHPTLTVRENLTLPMLTPSRLKWLGVRRERRETLPWLKKIQAVPADPERRISELSGGNQQKVVLARWLRKDSKVFLVDEPTQGVDINGKRVIYDAFTKAASSGSGLVVTSSDTDELAGLCSRVLVFHEGRIVAELTRDTLTTQAIIAEMMRAGGAA